MYRLFNLQIIEGEEHLANFNYKVEKTITTNGSRGNIYDRNGKLLAYSKLAYSVTLESTDETEEIAKTRSEETGTDVSESTVRNEIIYKLIQILEQNGDEISYNLPIAQDADGNLQFTETGSSLTRFLKDIYGIGNLDSLSGNELLQAEKWLEADADEVYEYLRQGTNGPSGTGNMFNIDDSYSVEDTLKIMSIRYDAYMNRYSQTTPITVANNISDESIAAISENEEDMPGVSIETNSLRKYNKAEYMAGIIGYTGVISESELEEYNKDSEIYSSSDIVGKTGIEKTMESTLRGKKGYQNVLVDNLGKIIKVVKTEDATVGSDVYLTIDSELQEYAYHILERRIAGLVLAHMTEDEDSDIDQSIPLSDVLFALINNNVVDIAKLNREDATDNEKDIYNIYQEKQASVFRTMREEFKNKNTAYNKLSDEKQGYIDALIGAMQDNGLLDSSKIDESDSIYEQWKDGSISFKTYINYAINQEWINIDNLEMENDYYDVDEIFDAVLEDAITTLESDTDFQKTIYENMIKNGEVSAKKICRLLYNQKVLEKKNDEDYEDLMDDKISAFEFMYQKIYNLEITPAQLALDPCSGSVVITDPDNGDVLAMVSYPSYDNNRLANEIDSEYYASLNADLSSPMLNRATQTRTAPGSTFKPISATAVLEENIITSTTKVKCTGLFDKITPNAKCWIYPDSHGSLNVSGAIAVSCNYFFYEMGYRMGSKNGSYDSETGLSTLRKYAQLYGLSDKSGVEISEYEPQISDEDAVRSSIGQGTNNYTPSQIARYVTSLVNQKELLELTLLDKTVSADGEETNEFSKSAAGELGVSKDTLSTIKKGMVSVVNGENSSIKFLYEGTGLKVAGKTGTAQENKNRPNHALFISYAPYDDPEITTTVVVRNGYASTNAAEIARDIYKYYFGKASKAEKEETTALLPSGTDSNND